MLNNSTGMCTLLVGAKRMHPVCRAADATGWADKEETHLQATLQRLGRASLVALCGRCTFCFHGMHALLSKYGYCTCCCWLPHQPPTTLCNVLLHVQTGY